MCLIYDLCLHNRIRSCYTRKNQISNNCLLYENISRSQMSTNWRKYIKHESRPWEVLDVLSLHLRSRILRAQQNPRSMLLSCLKCVRFTESMRTLQTTCLGQSCAVSASQLLVFGIDAAKSKYISCAAWRAPCPFWRGVRWRLSDKSLVLAAVTVLLA